MTITPNHIYITRNGQMARIYATDGGSLPIHGAMLHENGWLITHWYADGRADPPGIPDPNDLIREIALVWALDGCLACDREIELLAAEDYEAVVIDAEEFSKGIVPPFVDKELAREVMAEITTADEFPIVVIGGEIKRRKG